jgi:F-type H+-transporting ATPase subunit b
MGFNLWTFLFQAVNFVVLAYVLHRLLYRPIHDAIDRRREEDARARTEAEGARRRAETLQSRLDARLAEAEARRVEVIRQGREQAEAERERILDEAERAVARRREELEEELRRDREEAYRELRAGLAETAVGLAERLLRESADASLHHRLIDRLVETLRGLPADERERLRAEWRPDEGAMLEAAAPCDGPILERVGATLADLAGRPVPLDVRTLPALIGGARLRMGGHVWDATLADRLDEARGAASEGGRS